MASDDVSETYAALPSLYDEWASGGRERYALVAGGAVREVYDTPAAARDGVAALPAEVAHALVVVLRPLGGWRHPRFVVDSYRRVGLSVPTGIDARDPLARDFLVAERARPAAPDPDVAAPYLLIKDGAVLGRYTRVTRVRGVVDAAHPPLAPVVFTSLRLGRVSPFTLMVLQALVEQTQLT